MSTKTEYWSIKPWEEVECYAIIYYGCVKKGIGLYYIAQERCAPNATCEETVYRFKEDKGKQWRTTKWFLTEQEAIDCNNENVLARIEESKSKIKKLKKKIIKQ